jgi:hypothetical protein
LQLLLKLSNSFSDVGRNGNGDEQTQHSLRLIYGLEIFVAGLP